MVVPPAASSSVNADEPASYELTASYQLPVLTVDLPHKHQRAARTHGADSRGRQRQKRGHGSRAHSPRRSPSPMSHDPASAGHSAWLFRHVLPNGRHVVLAIHNNTAACLELHCSISAACVASLRSACAAAAVVRAPLVRKEWGAPEGAAEKANALLLLRANGPEVP